MKRELIKLQNQLNNKNLTKEAIEIERIIGELGDFAYLNETDMTEDEMTPGEAVGVGHAIAEKEHHDSSYMAKPQLAAIAEMSKECFQMIHDGEQIDDWMESHIAQAQQMLSSVHRKLKYKKNKYNI